MSAAKKTLHPTDAMKQQSMRNMKQVVPAASFLLSLMLTNASFARDTREQFSFDITAPSMEQALIEFIRQSGLQVLMPTGSATDVPAPRVVGRYTPDMALEQLLAGTDLSYEFANERTVAIRIAHNTKGERPFLLNESKGGDDSLAVTGGSGARSSSGRSTAAEVASVVSNRGIPEILIKGSRSLNRDIRRTEDDAQPYVVFDREQIEESQATNLEEFLQTRLPMNTSSVVLDQLSESPTSTTGGINLRGLGSNQTLVLVDGRRLPSVSTVGGILGQPDISGIPLSAVERIEILPTTASGIFGGSATGGVINIIRKKDYSGVDVFAKYGNVFDGDASAVEFSLSGGTSLEQGRSSIMFTASHSKADVLRVADRSFARDAREAVLRNAPATITGARNGGPISATPNICAARLLTPTLATCSGATLVLDNGQSLGASITYVPEGYSGAASDGGAALRANAGRYNLDIPNDGRALMRAPKSSSVALSMRRDFNDRVQLFLDGSGSKTETDLSSTGTGSASIPLAANASGNPFQQPILVVADIPNLSRPGWNEGETIQAAGGVVVRLPGDWSATVERTWGRTRSEFQQTFLGGGLVSSPTVAGFRANPLVDLNAYPISLSSSDVTAVLDFVGGPFDTILGGTAIRFSGPTVRLPGGPATVAALVEKRDEIAHQAFTSSIINRLPTTLYPRRAQEVTSYYVESRLPLVSRQMEIPAMQALEIQLSVRRDDYEIKTTSDLPQAPSRQGPFSDPEYRTVEVGSTDYTVGLSFEPTKFLMLRASVGTGFLPPSLSEIAPIEDRVEDSIGLTDPRRGDTDSYVGDSYTVVSGGNESIRPEKSRSWSGGAVLRLAEQEGFSGRLSIDYTRIKKRDEIYAPTLEFILQNETLFPGRVERGANIPGDEAGWAGPLVSLDASPLNLSTTEVEALDLKLDFEFHAGAAGRFNFGTTATQLRRLSRQVTPVTAMADTVGFRDGPLEWRAQANLDWTLGPLSLTWNMQHYDSYFVSFSPVSLAVNSNASLLASQGSLTIPSQTYHDLLVRYRFENFDMALLNDITVSLGIQNVFDHEPPLVVPTSVSSVGPYGYSTYGNPRLRRYVLSLQKRF